MTNTERGLTKGLIMRCLIYHVAPNRFQAMCLELDVEVVAGSKVAAFRELVRVLCSEACNDIKVRGALPFRGTRPAASAYRRVFKKAKEAPLGFGGDHCWEIRIAEDEDALDAEIDKDVKAELAKASGELTKAKAKAPPKIAKKTAKKAAKKTTRKQKVDAP